MVKISTVTSKD